MLGLPLSLYIRTHQFLGISCLAHQFTNYWLGPPRVTMFLYSFVSGNLTYKLHLLILRLEGQFYFHIRHHSLIVFRNKAMSFLHVSIVFLPPFMSIFLRFSVLAGIASKVQGSYISYFFGDCPLLCLFWEEVCKPIHLLTSVDQCSGPMEINTFIDLDVVY